MKEWQSIDDILDFAIGEEEAAAEFYTQLAGQASMPGMKEIFEGFAQEEQGHKAKLLTVKQGGTFKPRQQQVVDLKIADYLVDITPGPGMGYQQALIVAMKKEKAAFKLYTNLAANTSDENIKALFLSLAQEEARHKLRFELEYDDLLIEG